MMTPNEIEILIHCHVSPTPHPMLTAPVVEKVLNVFLSEGLIEPVDVSNNIYGTTSKGAAHINQLCSTPLPVKGWVDSHGNLIENEQ